MDYLFRCYIPYAPHTLTNDTRPWSRLHWQPIAWSLNHALVLCCRFIMFDTCMLHILHEPDPDMLTQRIERHFGSGTIVYSRTEFHVQLVTSYIQDVQYIPRDMYMVHIPYANLIDLVINWLTMLPIITVVTDYQLHTKFAMQRQMSDADQCVYWTNYNVDSDTWRPCKVHHSKADAMTVV